MKIHCRYDALVPISELRPSPRNRNKHGQDQVERLAKLLSAHGMRAPIVVSNLSGYIVKGHGTVLALKHAAETHAPVTYQDFESEEEEYQFLQADNAIASWAELDLKGIHLDLGELGPFDIELLGIKDFQFEPDPEKNPGEEDAVPESPEQARTGLGELWNLGNHRLLIGDCTVSENVDRLMSGENADMVFTDPPYGIGYEYNEHDDSSPEENSQLVATALLAHECGKVWTPGKMNLERDLSRFGKAKVAIWYKKFAQAGSGLGGASTFEPILILNPKEKKLPNDVIVVSTEREELNGKSLRELHSCPKPVELYRQLIEAFTLTGDKIAEPFCGSGTTLIACEKTQRKCYGMEIDPHYCDVILERWAKYTGKDPVREDGVKWSELKNA